MDRGSDLCSFCGHVAECGNSGFVISRVVTEDIFVTRRQVSKLPPELLRSIDYDRETGRFSSNEFRLVQYECRPRNRAPFILVSLPGYEIAAHRLVFWWLDMDPTGKVVVHLNSDRMDNRLENLELMERGEANAFRFRQRKERRDHKNTAARFAALGVVRGSE